MPKRRPLTIVILAMSADGKIADASQSAARFGSAHDKAHLEQQVAQSDAVLFGAGTLRAYGTTLRVTNPTLLDQRHQANQPAQPIQIVASRSADLDPQARFFSQPVPRWLLTSAAGVDRWQNQAGFEAILSAETAAGEIDWVRALEILGERQIQRLAVLGGGTLVAALLQADLIDQMWLTVCPLLLGGVTAPTPVEGAGFLQAIAPRLQLLAVQTVENEVFLHYQRARSSEPT